MVLHLGHNFFKMNCGMKFLEFYIYIAKLIIPVSKLNKDFTIANSSYTYEVQVL